MRKTWNVLRVAVGLVIAVAGCGIFAAPHSNFVVPLASGPISIDIDAVPVPLNPCNPLEVTVGDFRYAGGLILMSRQTDQLHGLSDLEVTSTGRLIAIGDLGIFLDAQVVLDSAGRLMDLTDAHLAPLTGEDGRPLSDKADKDAEGLALLPNGDRLVSFERRDRIWLYPAAGGPPRPVPMPGGSFPPNGGMEAVAADPDAGADAYVVGAEVSGDTWTCHLLSIPCTKGPSVAKPEEFGLVAIRRLPRMQTAYLLRAFDLARGSRCSLQIFRSGSMVARMDLAAPMTVDNFEGLAAVPRTDGGIRFYLISDDNNRADQRTLLLAFDWWPK